MPSPIQNQTQFTGAQAPQRTQGNFQQAVQRLQPTENSQPGRPQDSQVSLSPEALEDSGQDQSASQAIQGLQGLQQSTSSSAASPEQLESQIQSGDLQGALTTISELDAKQPAQGSDPNQSLKTQLKEKLQQGDQQGAQATLEQLKANKPSGPPPQQRQTA